MIPTPDKLKDIASLRKGDLSQIPYAVLVLALAVHRKSVVLEMKRTPLEKSIVFDEGSPVDCHSNVATETLGRFMVSIGKLSEADCQSTLNTATKLGYPLEEVLTKRKLVTPTELYRILQQNLARKLLDGFTWSAGTFRVSYDVPPVESPLRVKPSQLLVTGITKFTKQHDIDEAVASFAGKPLAINPAPLFPHADLRLTPEQQKLTLALEKAATTDELLKSTSLPPDEFNRLLYPLLLLRIAVTAAEIRTAAPSSVVGEETTAAAVIAAPGTQALPVSPFFAGTEEPAPVTSVSSDELMSLYIVFRKKDAFDLLDVAEDAPSTAINSAYLRFADRFAPAKYDDEGSDSIREKAEGLFFAGARAYAELSDNERRGALLAKRRTAREQPAPATAPAAATSKPTSLLDPDTQYRLGRQLADAGKHREALSHFQFASECDAQNGTYLAEVAYCRFQLMNSTATQTLAALKDVMRIDPKCGLAWYYTGKVHLTLGNTMESEAYLDKGKQMIAAARRTRR